MIYYLSVLLFISVWKIFQLGGKYTVWASLKSGILEKPGICPPGKFGFKDVNDMFMAILVHGVTYWLCVCPFSDQRAKVKMYFFCFALAVLLIDCAEICKFYPNLFYHLLPPIIHLS